MATARIPLEWGTLPSLTTRIEPATVEDVNDLSGSPVGVIDDGSTDDGFWFKTMVPADYASGTAPEVIVVAKTPAVSGNFRFLVNYRSIAVAETGDPTTWQGTPNSGNVAVPGTTRWYKEYPTALTGTDLAVDDTLRGEVLRQLSNAGDTVADVCIIEDIYLEYTQA